MPQFCYLNAGYHGVYITRTSYLDVKRSIQRDIKTFTYLQCLIPTPGFHGQCFFDEDYLSEKLWQ